MDSNALLKVLGCAACAVAVALPARVVYYLYFSPLAKIPGPKLYAFSDIPFLYYLSQGTWPWRLKELHEQYGPVVRFTHRDVSFIGGDSWKTIYGHKTGGDRNFDKCNYAVPPAFSGVPHVINAGDADHKRMRKLLSHAFSDKALRGQEDIMSGHTDLLIKRLAVFAENGVAADMAQWFTYTTFDIIGHLAFGEPFGCLESGGYHPWVAMLFDLLRIATLGQVFRRHWYLTPLAAVVLPRRIIQSIQNHFKLSREIALRRLKTGNTERPDFISHILRHNDEKGMSEGEIIENAYIIIPAGSETTATLLSGAMFLLTTNPEAYAKLVHEIRSSFASEDDITLTRVGELPYLRAVLEEALRMYPPVPAGLSRRAPKGGQFVEGYWIPENTIVSVPHLTTYSSEEFWHDPAKFAPERWMGDERYAGDKRHLHQPFSYGPRNCLGISLAYAEMKFVLTRVLWNFDAELMPECRNWKDQKIFTLWDKGPLNVKLAAVKRS
ncbi:cytochrome P450 [Stachybotrys elegans]|uniref:Cytochrome P450 n=1 Tax=Stachybotrys elegans TaxID=80388 RepID=A0A8K0SDQ5_9HYPO|nr:cytochrome P450 [Stachybotrys elegans]